MVIDKIICLYLLALISPKLWGEEVFLKGSIIRSLSSHQDKPGFVLIGTKGERGFVYESQDYGRSWDILNGGKPLGQEVQDIQSVVYFKGQVFAGSWKRGLFGAKGEKKSFHPVKSFPSKDIRSLKVIGENLYAGTPDLGLLVSEDGVDWNSLGLRGAFIWSLENFGEAGVLVNTLNQGSFLYSFDVKSFKHIFPLVERKVYSSLWTGENVFFATDRGLYVFDIREEVLEKSELFPELEYSSLSLVHKTILVASSWNTDQIFALRLKDQNELKVLRTPIIGSPISFLSSSKNNIYLGSWGGGFSRLKWELD